jgi:sugar phosphate isomerase/epimerase
MIKPAFSTVSCPHWTLERIASAAAEHGYEGVELRTFGDSSRILASDPALTSEAKTRALFDAAGVEILSLATGIRFDQRIPLLGRVKPGQERMMEEARRAIDLAVSLECPVVRVFAFEVPAREKRVSAVARVAERLSLVVDHAARTGVRIALENGGSFPAAADLMEIFDRVNNPLLGASYSLANAAGAGEPPARAIEILGERLVLARIKDLRDRTPCPLGEGNLPCRELVRALVTAGYRGPLVFEWDLLWMPKLTGPESVLPAAARAMFAWIAEGRAGPAGQAEVASPARAPARA